MLYEGVVLLCGALGQWLEPVGVVCHALFLSPLHHACCNVVGNMTVEACAIVHHVNHLLIDILWQILVHLLAVEDLASEILVRSLTWFYYFQGLLLESLTYYL